jgi:hypothetical protein
MTQKRIAHRSLDRVLSAIEEDLLHAGDSEILHEADDARQRVREVRALIDQQLGARSRAVPRGLTARRRLLAEILRARPTLSPAMSATFSDGKKPSGDEVDELIETLLRMGVLHDKRD